MSLAAVADPVPDRRGRAPPGPSRRPLRPSKKPARTLTFFARFLSLLRKNGGKLRKILAKLRQTGVKMRKKPGKLRNFRPKRARFAAILRKRESFSCTFSLKCAHCSAPPHSIVPRWKDTTGQLINNCRFTNRSSHKLIHKPPLTLTNAKNTLQP